MQCAAYAFYIINPRTISAKKKLSPHEDPRTPSTKFVVDVDQGSFVAKYQREGFVSVAQD